MKILQPSSIVTVNEPLVIFNASRGAYYLMIGDIGIVRFAWDNYLSEDFTVRVEFEGERYCYIPCMLLTYIGEL